MAVTEEWQAEWNAKCVANAEKLAATASDLEMRAEFGQLREDLRLMGIAANHSPITADLFTRGHNIVCSPIASPDAKEAMLKEVRTLVKQVREMPPLARGGLHKPKRVVATVQRAPWMDVEFADVVSEAKALGGMLALVDDGMGVQCIGFAITDLTPDARAALRLKRESFVQCLRRQSGLA